MGPICDRINAYLVNALERIAALPNVGPAAETARSALVEARRLRSFLEADQAREATETAAPAHLVIRSESGRYAGRTKTGAPLMLVTEPYAYLFDPDQRGMAEVLAANLSATWGERCEAVGW